MIRNRVFVSAFFGATLCLTAATAGTYSLCIGEYWQDGRHNNANDCGPVCPAPGGTQLYAYCYVKPKAKAASICRQEGSTGTPTVVHTGGTCGNKCGYG